MEFNKYVCWDVGLIDKVIQTAALQTEDHYFMATHNPVVMFKQDLLEHQLTTVYSEQDFLKDLLEAEDFAFVPILGEAGTGKSHLIRWLANRIENTPTARPRKVLLIPRSGTNLRNIIEMILGVMDESSARQYRQSLDLATDGLSVQAAKSALLDNLANIIEFDDRSTMDEETKYICDNLPSFLQDAAFRGFFLTDGGVIDRLVVHIIGENTEIEVVNARREFVTSDLPLNFNQVMNAGRSAQEFYAFLSTQPQLKERTIRVMNERLDSAMGRLLRLDREDLMRIMTKIRETLAVQNVELVLLIEDFAKLQGIDRQVLAAVIERPKEINRPDQCALRTVLGCTSGYFDNLFETVKQRISFRVTLDEGSGCVADHIAFSSLISRYLNALRGKEESVQDWYRSSFSIGSEVSGIGSYCEGCDFSDDCHSAFGEVNGYGLYPLSSVAIRRISARVSGGQYNPRLLLNTLKTFLKNHTKDLENGEFPPAKLDLGQPELEPTVRLEVESSDHVNAGRRLTLLDLWTDGTQAADLSEVIHRAFDLREAFPDKPRIGEKLREPKEPKESEKKKEPPKPAEPKGQKAPEELRDPPKPDESFGIETARRLKILRDWANGSTPLSQDMVQSLRGLVFSALSNRIQWDDLLMIKSYVVASQNAAGQAVMQNVGTSGFRSAKINFFNQAVERRSGNGIELYIGSEDTSLRTEEAVALQALLKYEERGSFDYSGGATDLRYLARSLDRWARDVTDQVTQRFRVSREEWDPVPVCTQLLATFSRLRPKSAGTPLEIVDFCNALFAPGQFLKGSGMSQAWNDLISEFEKSDDRLRNFLIANIACTKGGATSPQVINAAALEGPLRDFLDTFSFTEEPPDDLTPDYEWISKLYQMASRNLPLALEEERTKLFGWKRTVDAMLGPAFDLGAVVKEVRKCVELAHTNGVYANPGVSNDEFRGLLDFGQKVDLTSVLRATESLKSSVPIGQSCALIAQVDHEIVANTTKLFEASANFLEHSLKRIDDAIKDYWTPGESKLGALRTNTQTVLEELAALVVIIGGRDAQE